jgi:chromate transporter
MIVLVGGPGFEQIRASQRARAFLDGAGPAAIGAILGSAVTLTRELTRPWQYTVLASALVMLLPLRRGVVLLPPRPPRGRSFPARGLLR